MRPKIEKSSSKSGVMDTLHNDDMDDVDLVQICI